MKKYNVHITNFDINTEVLDHIKLLALSKNYNDKLKGRALVAKLNNEVTVLDKEITSDCDVTFYDIASINGFRAFQRTATFILFAAVHELYDNKYNVWVQHTVGTNFYCSIPGLELTDEVIDNIRKTMRKIVDNNFNINKRVLTIEEAMDIYREYRLEHVMKVLKYKKQKHIVFYEMNGYFDYVNGPMAPSSGYIEYFDLTKVGDGFIFQLENPREPGTVSPPKMYPKVEQIFQEYEKWGEILGIHTVGTLNDIVCNGDIGQIILISEALQEKKLAEIADNIISSKKRLVFVAGPSSSGKTTFAKRLGIQLRVANHIPKIISLDDYYKNRNDIPLEEDGSRNFENLDSLDVELFNNNMVDILKGKKVKTPLYNFMTGNRMKNGKTIELKDNEVLIIEGIHAINEALTYKIPREQKYKVYISALTQLSIDEHNRISTSDTRLIRRMVRDKLFRGFDAEETLKMWSKVLTGEEKNIFPYQDDADIIFNSSLAYEINVLKPFAEPLLFDIDRSSSAYPQAKRLLDFLSDFLTIGHDDVPKNSLLREFLGNSIFK